MRPIARLAVLGLVAGCATGAAAKAPGETAIPFVDSLNSVEWKAASDDSLYVRGGNGDRQGSSVVVGQRSPVESVTRSDGPPKKARRRVG
jgi:hypothetical protein